MTRAIRVLLLGALLGAGCSRGGAQGDPPGPGGGEDLAAPEADAGGGAGADAAADPGDGAMGGADLRVLDLAAVRDAAAVPDLTAPADMTGVAFGSADVDIYVDNFCRMDVVPKSITVPRGQTVKLTYRNRSRDYAVDVWLSYGGGYLDLKTGTSWADRFEHCAFPRPYNAYADISTACSRYRLMIYCP
jgi:hypothetical protein